MKLISLFTSLLLPLALQAELTCQKVVTKVVTHFEFTDPRLNLRQSDSIFLGEGVWGVVSLVRGAKGFKAVKNYKNHDQASHDHKALQYLKKSFSSSKLHIVNSQLINEKTMELEYAAGRTLEDIYFDPKVSTNLKDQLREKYIQALRELIQHFKSSDFLIDINHKELPRVSAQNDDYPPKGLHFILKPDNVIVNPETLELYLIDPS